MNHQMHSLTIGFLLLLLLAAAWHDIRSRRIPNLLVFPGAAVAVLLHALSPQEMGAGFLGSLAGLGTGLVLLLPLYMLRVMGAGDVKLMAMTGAFLGAGATIGALLCALLAGGVLALGAAFYRGKLCTLWRNLNVMLLAALAGKSITTLPMRGNPGGAGGESAGTLPYGVAIATGTMAYLAIMRWG